MTNIKHLRLLAATALLSTTLIAYNAFAATATLDTTFEIKDTVTITCDQALDFGTIAQAKVGDTVLNPDSSYGASVSTVVPGSGTAGGCNVAAYDGAILDFEFTPTDVVHETDADSKATVSDFTVGVDAADGAYLADAGGLAGVLTFEDGVDAADITIGGTLAIAADSEAGKYDGTVAVEVTVQ